MCQFSHHFLYYQHWDYIPRDIGVLSVSFQKHHFLLVLFTLKYPPFSLILNFLFRTSGGFSFDYSGDLSSNISVFNEFSNKMVKFMWRKRGQSNVWNSKHQQPECPDFTGASAPWISKRYENHTEQVGVNFGSLLSKQTKIPYNWKVTFVVQKQILECTREKLNCPQSSTA